MLMARAHGWRETSVKNHATKQRSDETTRLPSSAFPATDATDGFRLKKTILLIFTPLLIEPKAQDRDAYRLHPARSVMCSLACGPHGDVSSQDVLVCAMKLMTVFLLKP